MRKIVMVCLLVLLPSSAMAADPVPPTAPPVDLKTENASLKAQIDGLQSVITYLNQQLNAKNNEIEQYIGLNTMQSSAARAAQPVTKSAEKK